MVRKLKGEMARPSFWRPSAVSEAGPNAGLKAMSGDQLAKIIDFRGLFQFPAVIFVQVGLSHTVHHRGQLSMYLRPMGAKVPSIYGESYDAREAREKAQAAGG